MTHRIDALFNFLASQYTDSQQESISLLSDDNFNLAASRYETDADALKKDIYGAFLDLGIETADGMFRMGFLPEHYD
jgi:hypothetical protein